MYSLQHVFWRGAMALSLLVLGGVGAGVSEAPRATAQACPADSAAQAPEARAAAWREVALQRARMEEAQARDDA